MSKELENILNNNQFNSQTNSQTQNNSSENQEPSLMTILTTVLTPLIPVFLAKLTGQKMPNMITDNQPNLSQLTPILQNLVNTQNLLLQEMAILKNNAQILTNNLQSLRLTGEKERKQIGFDPKQQENYE